MSRLRAAVFALALVWPVILGAAAAARHRGEVIWSTVVYAAAGRVCHQQSARSFTTAGVPWPVCARCSGLYLAAPVGAVLGWRRRPPSRFDARHGTAGLGSRDTWILAGAAVPTAVAWAIEWSALEPVSNLVRAMAALPLGAAVTLVTVGLLGERPSADQVH